MKRTPLARRTPLRGGKALARGKGVRKRNPTRRQTEWERAYLSNAYVRFCKGSPCAACGSRKGSDAAHGESGGMGRKAGWETLLPLCSGINGCHAKQHQSGWLAIGMTEEGRRRAAANLRLAFADWQASGELADDE